MDVLNGKTIDHIEVNCKGNQYVKVYLTDSPVFDINFNDAINTQSIVRQFVGFDKCAGKTIKLVTRDENFKNTKNGKFLTIYKYTFRFTDDSEFILVWNLFEIQCAHMQHVCPTLFIKVPCHGYEQRIGFHSCHVLSIGQRLGSCLKNNAILDGWAVVDANGTLRLHHRCDDTLKNINHQLWELRFLPHNHNYFLRAEPNTSDCVRALQENKSYQAKDSRCVIV